MSITFDAFLTGKTALITGGSKRLGAQIALDLAQAGANIVIFDRSVDENSRIVQELRQLGHKVLAIRGDVAKEQDIRTMLAEATSRFGGIDVLVHNAGPWTAQPLQELDFKTWDKIMDANVKGAFMLAQLVTPMMKQQRWGKMIYLSAESSFVRSHTVYGLAKHSLNALTESLALEYAPDIHVNAVSPGLLDEPAYGEELLDYARGETPLGKLASYKEVSQMVLALCSPLFEMVTGKVIVMDGGRTIPRYSHHPPQQNM